MPEVRKRAPKRFQVNNIRVRYAARWLFWFAYSPDKTVLKAFYTAEAARLWTGKNRDYVKRGKESPCRS